MSKTDLLMNAKGTYYLCKSQSFSVPLLYPDPGEWIKNTFPLCHQFMKMGLQTTSTSRTT